jgi:hypothetical protein
LEALEEACIFLDTTKAGTLDPPGLHEFIDQLQLRINVVHQGIARTYFPPREGAASQSQMQFSTDERQVMPQTADAALD